jgi:hypothetical protein
MNQIVEYRQGFESVRLFAEQLASATSVTEGATRKETKDRMLPNLFNRIVTRGAAWEHSVSSGIRLSSATLGMGRASCASCWHDACRIFVCSDLLGQRGMQIEREISGGLLELESSVV